MKKYLLLLSAALIFTVTACNDQKQVDKAAPKAKTECCKDKEGCKGDHKCCGDKKDGCTGDHKCGGSGECKGEGTCCKDKKEGCKGDHKCGSGEKSGCASGHQCSQDKK